MELVVIASTLRVRGNLLLRIYILYFDIVGDLVFGAWDLSFILLRRTEN